MKKMKMTIKRMKMGYFIFFIFYFHTQVIYKQEELVLIYEMSAIFGLCNSFKLHSIVHAFLVVTCLLHIGILKTCHHSNPSVCHLGVCYNTNRTSPLITSLDECSLLLHNS